MQTNQANSTQNIQTTTLPPYGAPKSLGQSGSPKALGGGGDPALAQWYEQAYAYYNSVQSGQAQMPDQASWNEFLNQMNWAYQTLNGAGGGAFPMGDGAMGPQSGAPQEAHYDYESNEITATGEPITHRSWGIDETLVIPSMAAQVEYIWTTDTSVTPAQQVLKVKITNEITGTEEIVTFENADDPDFKLTIKAADPKSVTGTAPGKDITVEKFDMKSAENSAGAGSTASVPGELNTEGDWEYFGQGDETIHFKPVGDPANPQSHVFYGYVNFQLPGGSTIDYTMEGDDIVGVVKNHKGEITDTIRVKKGYTIDTQGHEDYITFNGTSYADIDAVPAEFDGRVMVGGSSEVGIEELDKSKTGFLTDLMELTGKDVDGIIDALNEAGIKTADGKKFDSLQDILTAMDEGLFPPDELNLKFIQFISYLDDGEGGFAELNAAAYDALQGDDHEAQWDAQKEMYDRLLSVLDVVYEGEKNIAPNDKGHKYEGFKFDGKSFFMYYDEAGVPETLTYIDNDNDQYKDTGSGWNFEKSFD